MSNYAGLVWLEGGGGRGLPDTEEVTSSNLVTPTNSSQAASGTLDVASFCRRHLDDLLRFGHIEASTHRAYCYLLKYVREFFGPAGIGDIIPDQMPAFVRDLEARGLAQGTVRKVYNLLVMCLKHARATDLLTWSPSAVVRAPKNRCPPPNPLTTDSMRRLLDHLDELEQTPCVLACHIALKTGMRRGEICGLRWQDVDLGERPTMRVCHSIGIRSGGTYLKETKTGCERTVPVIPDLARRIRSRRNDMLDDCSRRGVNFRSTHYVIGSVDGAYLSPYRITRWWGEHAAEWRIVGTRGKVCSFHDLRHTFATIAVRSLDLKTAQSIMGHSSVEMTMRYADTELSQVQSAIGAINGGFGMGN